MVCWCRQDLKHLQPLDIWALPAADVVVGGPDVLGGQHPDRGQRDIFVFGFPGGPSGAQGVQLPAQGTLVQLDYAIVAKPVPRLGAATAKVMAKTPRPNEHGARFPRFTRMVGLARGHPEESANSGQGSAGSGARVPLAHVP